MSEMISLQMYVEKHGQKSAADRLGCNQSSIARALNADREIYVYIESDGTMTATEVKPFPDNGRKRGGRSKMASTE